MESGTGIFYRLSRLSLLGLAAMLFLGTGSSVYAQLFTPGGQVYSTGGQAYTTTSQASSNSWALKMFTDAKTEMTRNFGDLALHAEAEQRFKFRNIYQEDVEILSAQSSCSCTNVTVPKKIIKSGEIGEIVARVDTSGRVHVGRRKATITVHFSRPYAAEVQLQVTSQIRADVIFEPGSIEFGSVAEGTPVTKTVRLQYNGSLANWQIVGMKKNSPAIRAEAKVVARQGNQKTYQVEVQLLATAEPGYINDLLYFTTNEAGNAGIFVPVHGLIHETLSVKPTHLQFGVLHPNESVTRNLVVRGSMPFSVESVSSNDDRMSFKTAKQDSTVQVIPVTLSVPEGEKVGEFQKSIRIKTTLSDQPELNIEVIGIVSEEPGDAPADGTVSSASCDESIYQAIDEYKKASGGPSLGAFEDENVSAVLARHQKPKEKNVSIFSDKVESAPVSPKYSRRFLSTQKIDIMPAEQTESKSAGESDVLSYDLADTSPLEVTESLPQSTELPAVPSDVLSYDLTDPTESKVAASAAPNVPDEKENSVSEKNESEKNAGSASHDEDGWFSAGGSQKTQEKSQKTATPGNPKVAFETGLSFTRPMVK